MILVCRGCRVGAVLLALTLDLPAAAQPAGPCALPAPPPAALAPAHAYPLHTYTVTPLEPDAHAAIALLDPAGAALGPVLSEAQFCDLAFAGSALIGPVTYLLAGEGHKAQAFCGRYYPRLQRRQPVAAGRLGRSRFRAIPWPYGLGARDALRTPGHTAAAPGLAWGTVLFAEALRGRRLSDGRLHDGYLVVADQEDGPDAAPGGGPLGLFLGRTGQPVLAAADLPPGVLASPLIEGALAGAVRACYAPRLARAASALPGPPARTLDAAIATARQCRIPSLEC